MEIGNVLFLEETCQRRVRVPAYVIAKRVADGKEIYFLESKISEVPYIKKTKEIDSYLKLRLWIRNLNKRCMAEEKTLTYEILKEELNKCLIPNNL